MNKIALALITITLLFGMPMSSAGQPSSADLMFGPDNMHFVIPDGYVLGSQSQADGMAIQEFIPEGEDINNWSSIYTLFMVEGGNGSVQDLRDVSQHEFFKTCSPGQGRQANIPIHKESGYDVAEWLEICEMTITGPSKGRPEAGYYKLSSGSDVTYYAAIAFHHVPSDSEIAKWRKFLGQVGWRN
jgi:hypothetical protein